MHMSCREYRDKWIELARSPRSSAWGHLRDHLESCESCSRLYEDQLALTAALQSLAAGSGSLGPAVEARVMAECRRAVARAWRRAVAACVVVAACVCGFALLRTPPPPPPAAQLHPFLTIPYTVPLAPEEAATVWRTRISVSALIAAGFQVPAADPSMVVEADVLVSQDGRARAIRPLSISISN